ncbi:MAG TPA: hypothetical protein VMK83_02795 [Gaiellaceae bacterium]|nr:hypothetical protein [Gaiellaceae bacterium]
MRKARFGLLVIALFGVLVAASASAAPPGAPKGLRGFELRPNEATTHTFPRTPAFAWNPVRGASCYEFELATSRTFDGSSVFWSNVSYGAGSGKSCRAVTITAPASDAQADADEGAAGEIKTRIAPIRIPAVSVNLVLPWFTGKPYALYARVRAVTTRGATTWSKPFGFNVRWESTPVPQATRPGLVRWAPVEGATAYDVWYPDIRKVIRTHTNTADMRELYSFHLEDSWWQVVRWRVRPVRQVVGALPNGLPAVSYGPWSPTYATANPAWATGKLDVRAAISDVVSSGSKAARHQLMPAMTFGGDTGLDGREYRLFRAYAFTDRDCVNAVFRGSVVGGPAFAPRVSGPLKLPSSQEELDVALAGALPSAKSESAKTYMADGTPVTASETFGADDRVKVDLPDVDSSSTRYYWTVVPVGIVVSEDGSFAYYDAESPQDACEAGRIASFGKVSRPAITSAGTPYVSGLSPKGRLLAQAGARPVVYSTPLVAWRPVVGATAYEVQWSRTKYPWRARGSAVTYATSSVLQLGAGVWYYRVRGLNSAQIGTPAMTWSAPVAVKVVRPTFRISGG